MILADRCEPTHRTEAGSTCTFSYLQTTMGPASRYSQGDQAVTETLRHLDWRATAIKGASAQKKGQPTCISPFATPASRLPAIPSSTSYSSQRSSLNSLLPASMSGGERTRTTALWPFFSAFPLTPIIINLRLVSNTIELTDRSAFQRLGPCLICSLSFYHLGCLRYCRNVDFQRLF